MNIKVRPYDHQIDYEAVNRFLIDVYEPTDQLRNWLQPRWEYMHNHPYIEGLPLEEIGVFEDERQIIGVAHFEHSLAFSYLQLRPGYDHLWPTMLDRVEAHFGGRSQTLERNLLGLFVNDFDTGLERLVAARGFEKQDGWAEEYSRLPLSLPIPHVDLPDGFRLQSLADDNDLHKINAVLWRGFDHEGEPPEETVAEKGVSQKTPGFRRELTIVAVAPGGAFVSYAGMWFVPENGVAYAEPVATDPDYRRMGLGRAAVLETVRRVAKMGARRVWVGSGLDFYLSMGFEKKFQRNCWVKWLD